MKDPHGRLLSGYWHKHWLVLVPLFLLGITTRLLTLLLPVYLGKGFELLLEYHTYRAQILAQLPSVLWDTWPHFLTSFLVILLLQIIIGCTYQFLLASCSEHLSHYLREKLFDIQMELPLDQYEQKGEGKYLLRWSGDLASIQRWFFQGGLLAVGDLLWVGAILILISTWFPDASGVLVVSFCSLMALQTILVRLAYQQASRYRNKKSLLLAAVSRQLRSVQSIFALNRRIPEKKQMIRRSEATMKAGIRYRSVSGIVKTFGNIWTYPLILLMLSQFSQETVENQLPTMLTAMLLLLSSASFLRRISRIPLYWQLGRLSYKKILTLLPAQRVETKLPYQFVRGGGSIKLQDSLSIQTWTPGQITIIHPPDHLPPTSVVNMLIGIKPATPFQIEWDNQDLSIVDTYALRKRIAVVGPDYHLLGRSVLDTISYSRKSHHREKARKGLEEMNCFLPSYWKMQPEDKTGDLGRCLHPTQVQLLMLLRARLSGKPIVVMTFPFMNIPDSIFEQVYSWMLQWFRKKTILIVASAGMTQGLESLFEGDQKRISI